MNKRAQGLLLGLVLGLMTAAGVSLASTANIPFSFSANTTARASEVNANFAAVKTAVDDTQLQVTALAGRLAGLESSGGSIRVVDANGTTVGPYFPHPQPSYSAGYRAADDSLWQLDFVSGSLSAGRTMRDLVLYTSSNCTGAGYFQINDYTLFPGLVPNTVLTFSATSTEYRVVKGSFTQTLSVGSYRQPASDTACKTGAPSNLIAPWISSANAPVVSRPVPTWTAPLRLGF